MISAERWTSSRWRTAEFEDFGPVQHFRDAFIAGWNAVRDAIDAQADGAA